MMRETQMNVVDGLVMLGRDTLLEAFGDLEGLCNDLETANPRWMTTAEVERLFKMTAAALGLVRVGPPLTLGPFAPPPMACGVAIAIFLLLAEICVTSFLPLAPEAAKVNANMCRMPFGNRVLRKSTCFTERRKQYVRRNCVP